MATYNGSQYIEKQLESFLNQTRKPDEIVICDDCSKDNTVQLIERFKLFSKLNIKIINNPTNLGVVKNFEKAIENTNGDIIFISDQDDYWKSEKISTYEKEFLNNNNLGLIFSDLTLADKKLNPLPGSLFTELQKKAPERYVGRNTITTPNFVSMKLAASGGTIAIRRNLLPAILPIPSFPALLHDGWIGRIASSISESKLIPDSYSYYRQHENNVIGYRNPLYNIYTDIKTLQNFQESEFEYICAIIERLNSLYFNDKEEIIKLYTHKKELLNRFIKYKSSKKHLRLLLEILTNSFNGNISFYFRGYRTIVKELLALLVNIFRN